MRKGLHTLRTSFRHLPIPKERVPTTYHHRHMPGDQILEPRASARRPPLPSIALARPTPVEMGYRWVTWCLGTGALTATPLDAPAQPQGSLFSSGVPAAQLLQVWLRKAHTCCLLCRMVLVQLSSGSRWQEGQPAAPAARYVSLSPWGCF